MNCLICQKQISKEVGLFDLVCNPYMINPCCCPFCYEQFKPIDCCESHCKWCLKKGNYQQNQCSDCDYWQEKGAILTSHHALFYYNQAMKEYIQRYKFEGDIRLSSIFSKSLQNYVSQLSVDYVIPIPLSKKREKKRGFNQVTTLLESASIEVYPYLKKIQHTKKQSEKNRQERLSSNQYFKIPKKYQKKLEGKTILLVDDIYTTGSTLQAGKRCFLSLNNTKVETLTLAR